MRIDMYVASGRIHSPSFLNIDQLFIYLVEAYYVKVVRRSTFV